MRRTFLLQIIVGAITSMFTIKDGSAIGANQTEGQQGPEAIAGKWHLLDAAADETEIPQHRMDLLFKVEADVLKGAILSRTTGEEIPLVSTKFDGSTLRLQMQAPSGKSQAEMPTLVMTRAHDKFEGYWQNGASENLGRGLKLVRARK